MFIGGIVLKNKYINKFNKLMSDYKKKKHTFSRKLAFYNLVYDFNGSSFKNPQIQSFTFHNKSNIVNKYIEKYCTIALKEINNLERFEINNKSNYIIWTFWNKNIEEAPELVQYCVEQMKHVFQINGYKVNVLSSKDILDYIDIPNYILEKVKSGKIGLALFSDFIRISLLEKYGGLWIDPTCYCTEKISDNLLNLKFYSCRTNNSNSSLVSKEQWANYCLGTNESHSCLYSFLRKVLLEYWKYENCEVDYLLTDYLIRFAYNNILEVKKAIDCLPENNIHRGSLMKMLNNPYEKSCWEEMISDTWLFKLTYKQKLSKIQDAKITYYGYISK